MKKLFKIIKYSLLIIIAIGLCGSLAFFFYIADVKAQQLPDVIVNSASPQGQSVENQDFNNLYQFATQIQNTANAVMGYFVNGILQPSSGGTGQNSSNWTSGDVVYMSSTGTWGHETLSHSSSIFLTSGTFKAASNVVFLTITGGGGGGGGNNSVANGGGGGGAGATIINVPYAVTPGNTYTVTVGSGGNPGSTGNGQNGGTSSFDALNVAGGSGGVVATGGGPGAGGAGAGGNQNAGIPTAGIMSSFPGGSGSIGASAGDGGGGGGSYIGSGGAGGTLTNGTSAAANTGAGGGGAATSGSGALHGGGNGGSGLVIVQY